MLTLVLLLSILTTDPNAFAPRQVDPFAAMRERYIAAFDGRDRAACEALWRDAGELVLPLIDADLEGSLQIVETSASPDMQKVHLMHERALWGSSIASAVSGHPILADYAAAFVGWNGEQAQTFRAGQKEFKESMQAAKKGEKQTALDRAESCCSHAGDLGDWWGLAMGHDARGRALQAFGRLDQALEAFALAGLLNHDLGLASDELADVRMVADLCYALDRDTRGLAAAKQGVLLARRLKDGEAESALLDREAQLEEKSGLKDAAAATRAALAKLRAK